MRDKTIQALIKAFDKTEELFFISKQGDQYEFIHSELTDAEEMLDMVYHFAETLEEKINSLKGGGDNDALDDLLNGYDIKKPTN